MPPTNVISHFINLEISSSNPVDAIIRAIRNIVIKFDFTDKYWVQDTYISINTQIFFPLESRLTDKSVNYTMVKTMNDRFKRVKSHGMNCVMRMIIRSHASWTAGPRPAVMIKSPTGSGSGSGRSQSNHRFKKHQGDFDNADTSRNSETVQCTRCGQK